MKVLILWSQHGAFQVYAYIINSIRMCIHHTQYTYNTALYAYIKAYVCTYVFIYGPALKAAAPTVFTVWLRTWSVNSSSLVPVLRQTNLDHVLASLDPSSYYRPFWIQVSKVIFSISRRSTQIFLCISRYLPACSITSRGITLPVNVEYGRPSKVLCSQHYGRPSNV